MARRKVTMLEAFQRSAHESAERAAAERRRVIAERERDLRRAEAAKTAQELGSRISQRASGVGSLLAGMRSGAPAEEELDAGASPAGTATSDAGSAGSHAGSSGGPAFESPSPEAVGEAAAGSIDTSPANELPAQRSGPELPVFDRAHQADLTSVTPSSQAGSLGGQVAEGPHSGGPGSADDTSAEAADESEGAAERTADGEEAEEPFAHATLEDVDHAIASLEEDTFELPMSGKAFAAVSVAIVAIVFFLGHSMGRQGAESTGGGGGDGAGGPRYLSAGAPLDSSSGQQAGTSGAGRRAPFAAVLGAPSQADDSVAGRPLESAPGPGERGATPAVAAADPEGDVESALTYADRAFQDPDQKFSILAITYKRTEAHAQLALETYDQLCQDGFPAVHPVQQGSRIYVFVGASDTLAKLEGMRDELRELETSRGTREFRSAFLVNIAPYR